MSITTGFDTAFAPSPQTAARLLHRHRASWWGVYIGGPYSGGHGWTPALVKHYAAAGVHSFLPIYVGQQAGGSFHHGNLTAAQGVHDAHQALALMKDFGWGKPAPVVLDVEFSTYATAPAATVAYARAWVHTVQAAGHRAGVYGNPPVLNALWRGHPRPNFVWVAHWTRHSVDHSLNPANESALIRGSWPGARFWQYTGGTNVDGVNVDISCANTPAAGAPGAHAPAPHPKPKPHPGPRTYTVHKGDTMSGIAARYHVSLHALESVNPQVKDPSRIFPGQRLHLPAGAHRALGGPQQHVTVYGESVAEIAERYHVPAAEIRVHNPSLLLHEPAPGNTVHLPRGAYTDPMDTTVVERTFTTAEGDTIAAVAAAFHVSALELRVLNALEVGVGEPDAGTTLKLPTGAYVESETEQQTVVVGHQSFADIAAQVAVSLQLLRQHNPQLDGRADSVPGEVLVLPPEAWRDHGVRSVQQRATARVERSLGDGGLFGLAG